MSIVLHILYDLLQLSALILLGAPVLYLLFFAAAGLFYRDPAHKAAGNPRRIAVFIPAYKEDGVIVETATSALRQDYPGHLFEIIVIADSLQPSTLERLWASGVTVIEVSFDHSTKTKALNRAMSELNGNFDIAVVLDADNIMAPDFLRRIDASLTEHVACIQGHRTAKNTDTPLAVLDAASEEINNHIFRKGHRAVGLSAAIIGSGMAFRYGFFREMMSGIRAVGGFDKEIELALLKEGLRIGYDSQAHVYDEKIRKATAFTNQRRRWLSAQLTYLRKDFVPALKEVFLRGNIDYGDKVLQFMMPPRILLLAAVILFSAVFIPADLLNGSPVAFVFLWTAVTVLCLLAFIISLPGPFFNRTTFRALVSLPYGVVLMILSLVKVRGANRRFLHTEHGPVMSGHSAISTNKRREP